MPEPPLPVAAIIPAAGSGLRLGGGIPKALRLLHGTSLLDRSILALDAHPAITRIVIAAPPASAPQIRMDLPACRAEVTVVNGGTSRQASVFAALAAVPDECAIVLVHDAARPLVPLDLVGRVIDAVAAGATAVVPGLPVADTVKEVDEGGYVVRTLPRAQLRAIQTPQGFRREVLLAAHAEGGPPATDDAALVERIGERVLVVAGDPAAMKITTPEDLDRAGLLVAQQGAR